MREFLTAEQSVRRAWMVALNDILFSASDTNDDQLLVRHAVLASVPDWKQKVERYRELISGFPGGDDTASEGPWSLSRRHSRIWGRFLIGDELGRGRIGVVYRALDVDQEQIVALKRACFLGEPADRAARDRFDFEWQRARRLRHPAIIQITEFGQIENEPFLTMELVDGANLWNVVGLQGVASEQAAKITQQLADAVQQFHEEGLIHGELKPSNVLLTPGMEPKLIDFGLFSHGETPEEGSETGCPPVACGHMSPERVRADVDAISERTDVYGLGVLLYVLLSGQMPYRRDSFAATSHAIVHDELLAPRCVNPDVDVRLEAICLKCLDKSASKRYPSARELSDDLTRYLSGQHPLACRRTAWRRTGRWVRRRITALGLASGLAIALLAVGSSVAMLERERNAAAVKIASAEFEVQRLRAEQQQQGLADRERHDQRRSLETRARQLMLQARYNEALAVWDEALTLASSASAAIHLERVKCFLTLNRNGEAQEVLDEHADLATQSEVTGDWLVFQAHLLLSRDPIRSAQLARDALESDAISPVNQAYARGLLSETMQEAESHLRQAYQREPLHPCAGRTLVFYLLVQGKTVPAREVLEFLRQITPDDADLALAVVWSWAVEGRTELAQAALQDLEPLQAGAQQRAGKLLIRLFSTLNHLMSGSYETHVEALFEAKSLIGETSAVLLETGNTDSELLLPSQISNAINVMLGNNPGHRVDVSSIVRNLLNVRQFFQSDPGVWGHRSRRLVEGFPQGWAYYLIAKQELAAGRRDTAIEFLKQALAAPSLVNVQRATRLRLMQAHADESQSAGSDEDRERHRQACLDQMAALSHLEDLDLDTATELIMLTRTVDGQEHGYTVLRRAEESNWFSPAQIWYLRGLLARREGDYIKAVESLRKSIELDPHLAEVDVPGALKESLELLESRARELLAESP